MREPARAVRIGTMEIINQWRAENWDPDDLLSLYTRAGAKYFVAMANHHDNFDNWDSSWHDWNSVRIGPRRDIVGIWAKKAREHDIGQALFDLGDRYRDPQHADDLAVAIPDDLLVGREVAPSIKHLVAFV